MIALTPGKRDRRTMDRHRSPRAVGSDAHPQPAPVWDRVGRVRGALQRPSASPNTEPGSAAPTAPTPCVAFPASRPTSRSARWTDTRIFPGRMTWMANSAPTGLAGCSGPRTAKQWSVSWLASELCEREEEMRGFGMPDVGMRANWMPSASASEAPSGVNVDDAAVEVGVLIVSRDIE
jgi:hypothetical protein